MQSFKKQAKEVIGATALEPLSRKHPTVAAHLESRCRFLLIVGTKAIGGREMTSPESLGTMALMLVFVVRAVFIH